MKTTTTDTGVELRPLEVTVGAEVSTHYHAGVRGLDAVFDELRRRGIDVGRPMWLYIDTVANQVTARQEPWEGA